MLDGDHLILGSPVVRADDVRALSPHDRSLLSGWLARSAQCGDISVLSRFRQRAGLAVLLGGAVLLIPWIATLSTTLPDQHSAHQWRLAWSGFDGALVVAFAFAAFATWRRRQI